MEFTDPNPMFCEHANEVPVSCPCNDDCYCRQEGSCMPRPNSDESPVPRNEESILQMRKWLAAIYPESKIDRALNIELSQTGKLRMNAKIWTLTNMYSITATVINGRRYLGCAAQSRKSRTGETWTRGNDLADGGFNEFTWMSILCDIVKYEAEEIKSERWKKRDTLDAEFDDKDVEDGFGSVWGPCPVCDEKMEVVRPGKVQCVTLNCPNAG